MQITNDFNISLPLAVWLLHDQYDYINEPNYISATSLLRPIKQLVLSKRVDTSTLTMDVIDKVASSLGNAVHDSIENAWTKAGPAIMKRLGYPDSLCERIKVNPTEEELKSDPNIVPIYFEKRSIRNVGKYKIGGKFDCVIDSRLFDFKSTSVYTYILGSKDEDYSLQGSIYRWLNPELIKDDFIYIQFIFTDWSKADSTRRENYPQTRLLEHPVRLKTEEETQTFIERKLSQLEKYWETPEEDMPECTDEELWRTDPKYKYYSDPLKTDGRSTRNFDSLSEANQFMASKGGKGVVITQPGEVKACPYCAAYSVCKQRQRYFPDDI